MNKVITKIRSGIGGYLKDNILFLTFVFASVLNGFLLRAFTVKFNYSQIKPLMADMAVILLLALISYVFKKPRKQFVYLLVLTIIFLFFVRRTQFIIQTINHSSQCRLFQRLHSSAE